MILRLIKLLMLGICFYMPCQSIIAGGLMGWTAIYRTHQRECYENKGFEITLVAPHNNPDVCTNNITVELACDLPSYKQILAMALTAQTANFEINGWVSGCDAEGQALVKSFQIR